MGEAFITRRGGTGGGGGGPTTSDAILTVTVPTGSTVTMTKGGITLTPTMWVQAADPTLDFALFVIAPSLFDSQNAWTVTATLMDLIATDTIIINASYEYNMNLSYRIPSAYQEVEYIERAANQDAWFDTGYLGTKDSNIEITFVKTAYGSSFPWLFGAFKTSSTYMGIQFQDPGALYAYNASGQWTRVTVPTNYKSVFKFINGTQLALSTDGGTTYTYQNITSSGDPSYTFALFGVKSGASSAVGSTNLGARIYSVFIDGRKYVPCYRKEDSVIGFWDVVGKVFITKSGSGTVTVGGDV